jgi:hypothetical protein
MALPPETPLQVLYAHPPAPPEPPLPFAPPPITHAFIVVAPLGTV